ncbi:MAG: thiol-disulfide isomerase/thioredoxin [Myxococcota bacterium]|jgi:thiol-disulfide isomerase/thioredoxin
MRQLLLLVALAAPASAADSPSGWHSGTPAANAASVLAGPADKPVITVPKELRRRVRGPTVLFYFSPTCPHCRHVAREVQALALSLDGRAELVGIASGSSTPEGVAEFRATFGVTFPILFDTDRAIGGALAIRSTPSAMLVEPDGKDTLKVSDLWYPYMPGFDAFVLGRAQGNLWATFTPDTYHGSRMCGTCHTEEYQGWSLSHHSVAWRTLQRKDAADDPKCTGCHVTGNGEPTGWNGDPTSHLVDVGCESCHGPGGPHDGTVTDPTSTCAACHDAEHSIAFTVAKGMPLIDHYAGSSLTEEQLRARLMALYDGDAPRELLAFPEGDTVGSAACAECHAAEHTWWASSPHASAMAPLGDSAEDPACVRCHATSAKMGVPPASELTAFRTEEGVGCEACHGPGAEHVRSAGAPGTIEGLGESCPVCVIEAVCTSCHTKKWDSDWDLDTHLPVVKHLPPAGPPAPQATP